MLGWPSVYKMYDINFLVSPPGQERQIVKLESGLESIPITEDLNYDICKISLFIDSKYFFIHCLPFSCSKASLFFNLNFDI